MRTAPGSTIVAVSTPLGPGALAVVRLSGDRAIGIADRIFRGKTALGGSPTHTVHHGRVVDSDGREVDEVLATVMRAPHTYTTEDMVEFGCHGGTMPARRVLDVCLRAGAAPARRGEFTERAFIGGRIDLVQAEAVADIVGARTRKGLEIALGQLEGKLSGELEALRGEVLELRAEVEAEVDLTPEEADGASRERALVLAEAARDHAERLVRSSTFGVVVREGVSVAIVGKPNVGKSSIMNALLMRDRSIVTSAPGTTRDVIEEFLHVDGVPVRLIDTAGWREATDEAERAGVERARSAARGASVTVLVLDASSPLDGEDEAIATALSGRTTVVAANKTDLGRAFDGARVAALSSADADGRHGAPVWVSALTGEGLDGLRARLADLALGGAAAAEDDVLVSNTRHIDAIRRVIAGLGAAARRLAEGAEAELVAVEIADCQVAIGEVTGATTAEDVLERIFERFCVGK